MSVLCLVNDDVVNIIVSKVCASSLSSAQWVRDKLREEGYNMGIAEWDEHERLAKDMAYLNDVAVAEKYSHITHIIKSFSPPFPFRCKLGVYAKSIAVFKALDCWLHNCSEGEASKTNLYKIFIEFRKAFACDIISTLEEYESADTWKIRRS